MKSKVQKKRDSIVKKLLSDQTFLPNLSIKQQLKLIEKMANVSSRNQIDELITKAKKMKHNKT